MGILIPLAPFIMVLGIVWANLHYKHLNKSMDHMTDEQRGELDTMSRIADRLDQRVAVLERILDDEVPNWREK